MGREEFISGVMIGAFLGIVAMGFVGRVNHVHWQHETVARGAAPAVPQTAGIRRRTDQANDGGPRW